MVSSWTQNTRFVTIILMYSVLLNGDSSTLLTLCMHIWFSDILFSKHFLFVYRISRLYIYRYKIINRYAILVVRICLCIWNIFICKKFGWDYYCYPIAKNLKYFLIVLSMFLIDELNNLIPSFLNRIRIPTMMKTEIVLSIVSNRRVIEWPFNTHVYLKILSFAT